MEQIGNSIPGIRSDRTYTPRDVLWTKTGSLYMPVGAVLAGSLSRDPLNTGDLSTLRPGMLMGKTTSGGKWRPSIIGLSTAAYVDNDTTITVAAATATEVARLIALAGGNVSLKLIGPATDADAGAIVSTAVTASAASGTTITCADLNVAKVTGCLITPADGAETPLAILDEFVRCTDVDGNSIEAQLAKLLISGSIDETKIINYPAGTAVRNYIKSTLLNAPGTGPGPFRFKGSFM